MKSYWVKDGKIFKLDNPDDLNLVGTKKANVIRNTKKLQRDGQKEIGLTINVKKQST